MGENGIFFSKSQVRTMYGSAVGVARHSLATRATSKILKFGLLSMKESLYMLESELVKYKWAKMESFFQSLKSVQCTEVPWAWRVGRARPATQPYIVENRENQL